MWRDRPGRIQPAKQEAQLSACPAPPPREDPPGFRTIPFRGCINCKHMHCIQTVECMNCTKFSGKDVYIYDVCDAWEQQGGSQ